MDHFKVGDVVVLKSGGPLMTVDFVNRDDDFSVSCKWFVGTELMSSSFAEGALDKTVPHQGEAAVAGGFRPSYPPVR